MLWNLIDIHRLYSKAVEGCIHRRQRDKENTGEFQFLHVNAIGCSCWNKEKEVPKPTTETGKKTTKAEDKAKADVEQPNGN